MQTKIQFEIVEIEVDKLFKKGLALTSPDEIDEYFEFIRNFITSCGWDIDDYTLKMIGVNQEN